MLNSAFDALKTYDWGADSTPLKPIEDAILSSHGDAAARKELEARLAAVLKSDAPRDAKDYVCRKLMVIGSAASVPALADLLGNAELSHMARFALERISAPEAAAALRDSLAKLSGALKVGVLASLGVRRDAASVVTLASLVAAADASVAAAAAYALGAIRTTDAAKAIAAAKPASDAAQKASTDASLACAEALLADGKKAEALAIYKGVASGNVAKHVKLAATRGILACAGKQ